MLTHFKSKPQSLAVYPYQQKGNHMFFTSFSKNELTRWFALITLLFAILGTSNAFATTTTTIVAQNSGKCLDVRGGVTATGDGVPIEQWTCSGQANQAWALQRVGAGKVFEIIASNSGKCLTTDGGLSNGTAIQQMTCAGQTSQLWRLKSLESGLYEIINNYTGRCLDVTGGPAATGDGVYTELWDCSNESNQAWTLTAPTFAPNQMMSMWSGKCLDVTGGTSATGDGVPIEQWTCSGQSNEAWTVQDMGGYQYEIIAHNSGKCLDIVNSNPAQGTAIQQMPCTGNPNQLWVLHTIYPGQFQVRSVLNNQNCLNVRGAGTNGSGTDDGALIEAGNCGVDGNPNTGWRMEVAVPIKYSSNQNECLDVRGGEQATADGTPVEIWTCTGLKNQLWTARDIGDGEYQLIASNSGKCLNLVSGVTEGSKVQIAPCANTPTQLWFSFGGLGDLPTFVWSDPRFLAYILDIVGGPSAAADGVLTQVVTPDGDHLRTWLIGTPATGQ
jgi:hypothetical protein